MILRARIVLPISQPPIENGAVIVHGSQIAAVGRGSELSGRSAEDTVDLGEVILLPGLVNAHCHLDYTGFAGHIPPPRRFTDWIKAIVALKASWSYTEFAESWLRGAQMLLQSGVTTVADVEAVPELLPEMWGATPLRVVSFRELIQLKVDSAAEALQKAARACAELPGAEGRIGLSPHAPYSTTAELLRAAANIAGERGWPLTTHAAESEEEFEMFMYRHGTLYDWLKNQRDMSDCGLGSPIQHLEATGYLAARPLLVHVNHLWRHDAALLAQRGISVVHCPRSHDYFRHLLFPRLELAAAGVNICLGTDSLASSRKPRQQALELSLFAEMQQLAAHSPDLTPSAILRMATINGAIALRRQGQIGQLSAGAMADLIAVPCPETTRDLHEAVLHHRGPVAVSMIGGSWAIAPPGRT